MATALLWKLLFVLTGCTDKSSTHVENKSVSDQRGLLRLLLAFKDAQTEKHGDAFESLAMDLSNLDAVACLRGWPPAQPGLSFSAAAPAAPSAAKSAPAKAAPSPASAPVAPVAQSAVRRKRLTGKQAAKAKAKKGRGKGPAKGRGRGTRKDIVFMCVCMSVSLYVCVSVCLCVCVCTCV